MYSVIAIDIDITSKALNKKIQFKTRNTPQNIVEVTFLLVNVSFLCWPINHQIEVSINEAQMHRINTSSNAGIPVCIVKNPIDPNMPIDTESFIMADLSLIKIRIPLF